MHQYKVIKPACPNQLKAIRHFLPAAYRGGLRGSLKFQKQAFTVSVNSEKNRIIGSDSLLSVKACEIFGATTHRVFGHKFVFPFSAAPECLG